MVDIYDVIIIGGGMAGMSAGLYAARWRMKVLMLEKTGPGGQIINADVIENYPGIAEDVLGMDLVNTLGEQAAKVGLESGLGEVVSVDANARPMTVKTYDAEYKARSVILAVGGDHAKLGVPGEVEYEGRGVSYCATCDGPFFQDKDIVVVGGGDSALDEGIYLTKFVRKVIVVHHKAKLQAQTIYQERARQNPKIEFIWDTVVDSIQGNDQGVTGVSVRSLKTEEKRDLVVAGCFIFVGMRPQTSPFQGIVPTDGGGHVKVDLRMSTGVPGVFAAGDCRWQSSRQLVNSAADGVTAAFSAYEFLQNAQ